MNRKQPFNYNKQSLQHKVPYVGYAGHIEEGSRTILTASSLEKIASSFQFYFKKEYNHLRTKSRNSQILQVNVGNE